MPDNIKPQEIKIEDYTPAEPREITHIHGIDISPIDARTGVSNLAEAISWVVSGSFGLYQGVLSSAPADPADWWFYIDTSGPTNVLWVYDEGTTTWLSITSA